MKISQRKKAFLSIYFVAFISFIILTAWGQAGYISVFAQSSEEESNMVVKIPPPLEGGGKKGGALQNLETADIKILTSSGKVLNFNVEVAKTNEQRSKGLMFRNVVPEGSGMLFLFDDIRERSFWMKNTWVSLDLIFIREDGVIHNITSNTEPYSLESISSNGEVAHVLEIAGGEAERLEVSIGDRVMFSGFKK